MQKPALVIMAAGMGSRYGGLKQIDPVGPTGEIIMEYSVYDALKSGFGKIVFVIKKELEALFRERVGRKIEPHAEVVYVFQDPADLPAGFTLPPDRKKPWGTAHAVLACREVINSPFAVLNADDFYGRASFLTLARFLSTARDGDGVGNYAMVGYVLENTLTENGHVARGVCSVDEAGYLTAVTERTRIVRFADGVKFSEDGGQTWTLIPAGSLVSMNMWGFTPGLFPALADRFRQFLRENINNPAAEFFIPSVVGVLLAEGRVTVQVLPTAEQWFGVTYQPDRESVIQSVQALIGQGLYPADLWANPPV